MATETREELIKRLKQYALKKYNEGGDRFVECFEDSEWIEFIEKCDRHNRGYITCMLEMMGVWEDQRKGIENEIF